MADQELWVDMEERIPVLVSLLGQTTRRHLRHLVRRGEEGRREGGEEWRGKGAEVGRSRGAKNVRRGVELMRAMVT